MADDADRVAEAQLEADAQIHAHRYEIPSGYPGECRKCEKKVPRLIGGLCGRCRDGR